MFEGGPPPGRGGGPPEPLCRDDIPGDPVVVGEGADDAEDVDEDREGPPVGTLAVEELLPMARLAMASVAPSSSLDGGSAEEDISDWLSSHVQSTTTCEMIAGLLV